MTSEADPTGQRRPVRVLILTSDAGSGHRSAARAIEAALTARYGEECHVTIINPLHLPEAPPILRFAERAYLDQIKYTPQLYHWQHDAMDMRFFAYLVRMGAGALLQDAFEALLDSHPVDVVVSVYPLFGKALTTIRKRRGWSIPHIVVVTDLVAVHKAWFEPTAELYLVPTDAVSAKALQSGLTSQQVRVTGLPVHPALAQKPADRRALRIQLGWDPERPAVLVLGAGAGLGKIPEIAAEIAKRCPHAQMALVAGHNKSLQERLASQSWAIPTKVYGFTEQMPSLMHAADVLVTKAGGLSVSEGLACGLPLVIHHVTPGQEEGNLAYVETRDAGVYAPTPKQVGDILARWLQPGNSEMAYYAANAREAGRPHAADRIAMYIWKLAHQYRAMCVPADSETPFS